MTIPMSLMTHVKTFDVAALKSQQAPVSDRLAQAVGNGQVNLAPDNGVSAADQLQAFEPRSEKLSTKLLYAKATSGSLNPMSFKSTDDAAEYAASVIQGFRSYALAINTYGEGDVKPGGAYTAFIPEENQLNDTLKLAELRNFDRVETSRMYLAIDAGLLDASFEIDEPMYEVEDGELKIRAFDISYDG